MELKCPLSQEELEQAKQKMMQDVWDWVLARYPKIHLAILERNLATFVWLKMCDDACPKCMSVQMCPSQDGNRGCGKLMADGVVSIWMEPCPKGYKLSREGSEEKPKRQWMKQS